MPTSGNTSYSLTTSAIIQQAFEKAEIISAGDSVPTADYNSALIQLNLMVKDWQNERRLYLQHIEETTLFLNVGQRTYQLGNNSTDHYALNDNLIETKLTEDEVSTDTLIHVNDTTGMAINDIIGVVLDTSEIHWSTVNTVNSSTTVTLNNALPEDATQGNYVFSYRDAGGRPLEIVSAMLRQAGGTDDVLSQQISEIPVSPVSQETYFKFPNKGTQGGSPLQFFMDKKNTHSVLNLYPVPNTPSYRIKLLVKRIIENFDSGSDIADLPQESGLALIYGLACLLATNYRRSDLLPILEQKADRYLDNLCSVFQENNVSTKIVPKY